MNLIGTDFDITLREISIEILIELELNPCFHFGPTFVSLSRKSERAYTGFELQMSNNGTSCSHTMMLKGV